MGPASINSATALPALQLGARAASASGTDGMVYNDLASLGNLKTQSHENPQEALKEVARQFESVFVTMMMKSMRDALPKDGLFASSQMETYQEMFDQQLSLDLASNGGLGLASVIERQMSRTLAPDNE
jgi:Rod binding domain-containing protein